VYEYLCQHVVQGCTTKISAETREQAVEGAKDHVHEHHPTEYIDDETWLRIATELAVMPH
jgi:predicted small metal-binding protein